MCANAKAAWLEGSGRGAKAAVTARAHDAAAVTAAAVAGAVVTCGMHYLCADRLDANISRRQ